MLRAALSPIRLTADPACASGVGVKRAWVGAGVVARFACEAARKVDRELPAHLQRALQFDVGANSQLAFSQLVWRWVIGTWQGAGT